MSAVKVSNLASSRASSRAKDSAGKASSLVSRGNRASRVRDRHKDKVSRAKGRLRVRVKVKASRAKAAPDVAGSSPA